MLLSVIIVNYNVKYCLEYCLTSVTKAMANLEGEIFVVDNNSTDGSKNFFCNKFPGVNFIWNTENMGFARANNLALLRASGQYVLFLNPDTIVSEDCFEKCITFIQSKSNRVACGVKMINGNGKFLKESKRAFPTPVTSLYKLSGLSDLFPKSKIFSKYHLGFLNENENHEVDVLAGAFIMLPKKILDKVGSFDETFFMYGEDIDLSFRIQEAGYKNFYFAETSIIHFKGESTKKGSLNYVKMFYKAMSVFVKKHYGSAKAGMLNFPIQVAIFLRALLSALARFVKWIGLPSVDAAVILISFWLVKFFWSTYIKQEVNYSPNMLIIAFPAFTVLFLTASYFAGLYDGGYRQSSLNKSAISAMLVLLAAYALLPETLRFSRGILLFGCFTAFFLMTFMRWLLVKWNVIGSETEKDEINQTIVAGTEKDFICVRALLQRAGMHERIMGRVDPGEIKVQNSIGRFLDFADILKEYPVKEIIFCEGTISFKKIIEVLPQFSKDIRKKFYAPKIDFLIGVSNNGTPTARVLNDASYNLSNTIPRRNKMLSDILISLFFLMTFPFHFIVKSKPLSFFKNVFLVLFQKKTWIGFVLREKSKLPQRPGVLSTTGLPASLNTLPDESLAKADEMYANNFKILNDMKMVWLNYKFLSM